MALFFWQFNDYNDIERQWVMFIINILAVAFTVYSLTKTAKYYGKVLFQIIPLTINAAATTILLFIKLFQKGYEFDLVGFIIQIFTYFLFSYTFSVMHVRLIATKRKIISKFCNLMFVLVSVLSFVLMVLVMASVISKDCDNNLFVASSLGFVFEVISYIPAVYFGIDILRKLTKKHQSERMESTDSQNMISTVSDQYILQRQKQIKMVLAAYSFSIILRGVILYFNYIWQDYFCCIQIEGVIILSSDNFVGQLMLYLIEINQLIPHLIIPIALYVIPVKKTIKSSTNLNLQSTLLIQDYQDESVDSSDLIQRRVSQSLLSKSRSRSKIEEQ